MSYGSCNKGQYIDIFTDTPEDEDDPGTNTTPLRRPHGLSYKVQFGFSFGFCFASDLVQGPVEGLVLSRI